MSLIVEVSNLSYTYEDGTQALKEIDFELEDGATIALLGANGSGKTTFVHHLNGILPGSGQPSGSIISSGSIIIDGLPMTGKNLREIRKRVGLVFQDSDNQLFMPSVLEDVTFGPLAWGMTQAEAVERAEAALDRVGLRHKADKAPWHLSAGEKKRAAIAGILATDARLLVLDEPTTFLDPPGQRALSDLLASLPQAKILVTHDSAFARGLTGEAVFFDAGTIAARGPIAAMVQRHGWQ